jgi:hypothetical protein
MDMAPMKIDSRSLMPKRQPDGEREVAIKSTVLHAEPVYLEFSLRTARLNNSAAEALLATAFPLGAPLLGGDGCAEGLGREQYAPTRAPSFASSSVDSCDMNDAVSVNAVGEEMSRPVAKKKCKSNGLKDSKGRRPGKKARELYYDLVSSLEDMVRQDPSLSLASLPIPQCVLDQEMLMTRLVARVEAARTPVS